MPTNSMRPETMDPSAALPSPEGWAWTELPDRDGTPSKTFMATRLSPALPGQAAVDLRVYTRGPKVGQCSITFYGLATTLTTRCESLHFRRTFQRCAKFMGNHFYAWVEHLDLVVSYCEGCGREVYETDDYGEDEKGVVICSGCLPEDEPGQPDVVTGE